MTMADITKLPDLVGIADNIENWNTTSDSEAKQAMKRRIETIITTNPDVKKHITEYYHTDSDMITRALGYVPQK